MALLFIPLTVEHSMAEVAMVLLLGILVVIPLALDLLADSESKPSLLYRVASDLQPIGAVLAAVSFFFHEGIGAAVLTAPWLLFSLVVAVEGIRRFRVRFTERRLSVASAVTNIGFLGLPAGTVWLVLSRLGYDPGSFGELMVLLTAVHFHFAAFVAPIWVGFLGQEILQRKPALYPAFRILAIGLVAGVPLVAAGIAVSSLVETAGVFVLAVSGIGLGVLGLILAPVFADRRGHLMLWVSSAALCVAMIWALVFSLGPRFDWPSPDIIGMIPRHGWIQGVGFALVGMLAWRKLHVKCHC